LQAAKIPRAAEETRGQPGYLGPVERRLPKGEELDRLVAAILVVLGQIELWVAGVTPGPKPLTVPLAIAIPATVAVRRRHPLAAVTVMSLAFTTLLLVDGPQTNIALGIAFFSNWYALAVWTETREFLAGCGVVAVTSVLAQLGPEGTLDNAFQFTVIPIVAMLIARRVVRDRQLRAEALEARAEALEREQELRARDAVADERARIARELHDLVAHNVSLMVVQAGAERHALPPEQESTRQVLASIEQAGRQALVEARRLLGMLRGKDAREELEPQPTLDRIDDLVDQVRRAGLEVTVAVEGERTPLPAGVDLCAYRLVQEGLTNALRHAGPAHAEVKLRFAPRALDVEIRDDGRGPVGAGANGSGHGLIGMRERVALYGGEVHAGPRDGGGFEVRARLPIT
jgi:signal transduction histidine kinase